MAEEELREGQDFTSDAGAEWANEGESGYEESDLSFYAESEIERLEIDLSNHAFCHALTLSTDRADVRTEMQRGLKFADATFKGLKSDSGANKSSNIGIYQ